MPEVILALLVAIAIVTLAGHGIWITVAWLIRALFGLGGREGGENRRLCPFCQRWTPRDRPRCDWCGHDLRSPLAAELADVDALKREVKRLQSAAVLTPGEAQRLLEQAEEHRGKLLEPVMAWYTPASVAPATSPGAPPPVAPPGPKPPSVPPKPQEPPIVAELVEEPRTGAGGLELRAGGTGWTLEAGGTPVRPPASGPEPPVSPPKPQALSPKPRAPSPKPPSPPPVSAAPQPAPRPSWLDLLASFLEERNIHWAELIGVSLGGLLMVGASIALVITLWERLAEIPLFKFTVFVTYTSAVFAAGLFAYWRWKLPSTGRGLLTIAVLLVPLNFLAMASLSPHEWTLLNVAWEAVSLAIFVYLVGLAAGVLVPRGRWHQVGAVVGNSAAVLLLARLGGMHSDARVFLAAGLLPVGVFGVALGSYLRRLPDRENLGASQAAALFSLLGTGAFAMLIAVGLLIARGVEAVGLSATLDRASLLVALAAWPVLAAGLAAVRGVSADRELGAYRAAGTMVALAGAATMIAAVGMAWPNPLGVLAVAGFNAAALALVAFRHRLPAAHAGTIACAAILYLTGFHVAVGNLPLVPAPDASRQMLALATGAQSGAALVGLVVMLGVIAELLGQREEQRHAVQYLGGAAVVALVSLVLVTANGLRSGGDEAPVALVVYAVYGVASLLLSARFRQPLLTYSGLGLLVGATLWGLWWQTEGIEPIWATVLVLEALVMGLVAAKGRGGAKATGAFSLPRQGAEAVTRMRLSPFPPLPPVPLLHVAEVVAPLGLAIGVWTAWQDLAVVYHTPTPVVTAIYATAFYLLVAWVYRSVERTWAGSMIALAGLVHTCVFNYIGWLHQPWLGALLAHASLCVAASAALDAATRRWAAERPGRDIRRVFVEPLGQTALVSSLLAIGVLVLIPWRETASLAACLFWLAAIWLVIAWTNRWPVMLAAAQAVLTLAMVVAATAWLQQHPWDGRAEVDLLDPRSLQAYGIGLGLLTLAWLAVRIALCRNALAQHLLEPGWPGIDRLVGHAVVAGQLLLSAACLTPGCLEELARGPVSPAATTVQLTAFGPTAWLLLAVTAAAVLVALWHRWGEAELAAVLLVAAALPCLAAGPYGGQRATASALRWGLAITMAVASAAVWQRQRLAHWCNSLGGVIAVGPNGPRISRAVLLVMTAAPILLLTLVAALQQMAGVWPGGPAPGSFFASIGPELAYLVPLLLVTASLVGFALRETSPEYAFSAGLVVKMAVALGYLLSVVTGSRAIGVDEVVTVFQLLAITAAAWGAVWVFARRWTRAWTEGESPSSGRTLMSVELGMAAFAVAVVWVPAVTALGLYPPRWHEWAIAAGSWLGWAAWAAVLASAVYRHVRQARPLHPDLAGLAGLVTIGLLACTVRGISQLAPSVPLGPEWGYRTLMLGWGMYALVVVLLTWWVASLRTLPGAHGPPQGIIRAAAVWVSTAGVLAGLLGLKAAFLHREPEDLLWAAAAIGLASAASAAMSVWRRREGWAFAAAPGVNLAASLVVWYYQHTLAFHQWWILLVQANVIASASVALVWLAARKRLYELRELTLGTSPLLAVQTALGAVGTGFLLILPVVHLVAEPARLPRWAAQMAEPAGWISLALAALACACYLRQAAPKSLFHVVGALGLAIGALVACSAPTVAGGAQPADWLAYHLLTTSWAAAALVVLGVAKKAAGDREVGPGDAEQGPGDREQAHVFQLRLQQQGGKNAPLRSLLSPVFRPLFPVPSSTLVTNWVGVIAAAAVALALMYCLEDPARPWWSARAILAASLTFGLLAVWVRLPACVYVSGLLLNAAATVVWMALEDPWTLTGFIQTNSLALGLAACVWTLIRAANPRWVPELQIGQRRWPFAPLAADAGLALLAVLVAAALACDASAIEHSRALGQPGAGWLGWLALGAVVAAACGRGDRGEGTGDRGQRSGDRRMSCAFLSSDEVAEMPLSPVPCALSPIPLYCAGLVAVGMALSARGLSPRVLAWTAAHELAGFVLLAAAVAWLVPRLGAAWTRAGHGAGDREQRTGDRGQAHVFRLLLRRVAGKTAHVPSPLFPVPCFLAWFPQAQATVALVAMMLSAWVSIDFAFDGLARPDLAWISGRMAGPLATAGLVLAAILTASRSPGRWRSGWQCATFALAGLGIAELAWAWLNPAWIDQSGASAWLHRNVILMTAAVLTTLLVAFGLARVLPSESDWITSGRRMAPVLAGLAPVLLVVVLGQEAVLFKLPDGTPMAFWAIAVVAAALVGLTLASLALALKAGLDPLGMSDRGRTAYVYAAEVLAALVGVHLWLAMPWLLRLGIVEKYWMLLVMAGAALGAGLSEVFHRRGMPVLSQPLARTALLLPLAPAVMFWLPVTPPAEGFAGASPAFWFLAMLFYGYLAVEKRSPLLSLAALVAANVGLGVLWHQWDLGFRAHPQLWLIPVGLSALVAEHLNYDRLSKAEGAVLRYLGLSLIYVSSSAEFLGHLGESYWLPMVLTLLSVLGVLAGIVLRVRSFVVLGATFLVLVIVTMICYAAFWEQHIWILWVFFISVGAAIIALVGLLAKHRETMLEAVTRFRQWEPRRLRLTGKSTE